MLGRFYNFDALLDNIRYEARIYEADANDPTRKVKYSPMLQFDLGSMFACC